jgi:D-amino-acid oxidase
MDTRGEVVVVGAGVSGLSCAIRLLEAGWRVRILARERTPNTTSDVAGAVWYPFRTGPPEQALAWGRATFEVLRRLVDVPEAGVMMVPGIELLTVPPTDRPGWAGAVGGLSAAEAGELPAGYPAGWRFEVPTVAMARYMPWLEQRVADLGGRIEARAVEDLDALLDEAPVVVHCAGLGARELADDPTLAPVRGQVVRVAAGFADRFVQEAVGPNRLAYVIPRVDCTVLGGTEDEDAWDTTVQPEVSAGILRRCRALEPALAEAPVLSEAVGLRPCRPAVRLEAERRPGGWLVHNYGHGGAGVTLSWGCADAVRRLVEVHHPGTSSARSSGA